MKLTDDAWTHKGVKDISRDRDSGLLGTPPKWARPDLENTVLARIQTADTICTSVFLEPDVFTDSHHDGILCDVDDLVIDRSKTRLLCRHEDVNIQIASIPLLSSYNVSNYMMIYRSFRPERVLFSSS